MNIKNTSIISNWLDFENLVQDCKNILFVKKNVTKIIGITIKINVKSKPVK